MKLGSMTVVTLAALAVAGCGGSTSAPGGGTHTSSRTATADLKAAAATAYASAFNTMIDAVNVDVPKQNKVGTDPTGAAAAINDEVTVRQTFDTAVSAITFPSSDQADAQAVLSADAALEGAVLGTLAVRH